MDYPASLEAMQREQRRELARMQRQIEQMGRRLAMGRVQNPRLAITMADPEADPEYPADDSGATVFPIAFISAGFTHAAGVQTLQYTEHRDTPQCQVFSLTGGFIPEGTVIEVFQQTGVDATYPGEWWTSYRCLPAQLLTNVRISGDELIQDKWSNDAACDAYVPYVVADLTDCDGYVPGDPPPDIWFNGPDSYEGWTGFDDDPDNTPWQQFDDAAYFIPEGGETNVEHCIELSVTIGADGGFLEFDYIILEDLTALGIGPLECKVDGVVVFSGSAVDAGTAGPFTLATGARTISFCIDYATPSIQPLAKVENVTIWGIE